MSNGYNVEGIESKAFQGNLDIETFVCNADIKSVGDYAFESCAHMETASFNGKVEKIGSGAFSVCSSLSKVELPDSLREIGDGAFLMDNSLKEFNFPSNLETIGEYAFAFSVLTKADMNCKVKTIPERLFADCQNLSEVTLPAALEKIDDYAFFQCNELTLSNIPETVEVIGKSAFKGTQVSNLRLNCSQIGENAFMGCFNLQSITFSDNLQKISAGAFIDSMVDEFVLPENAELEDGALRRIHTNGFSVSEDDAHYAVKDGVLFSKDMKKLIAYPSRDDSETSVYTVPHGVEVIAPYAFDTAYSLTEIILPDTVREIGSYAFFQSGIEKIKLPDSVKSINEGVFQNCQSLQDVDLGKAETIDKYAFRSCSEISLSIPETVKDIHPLAFASSNVKPVADANYKTVDGVLFTGDGKTIVFYPGYLESRSYTIPDGVENVCDKAFISNNALNRIYVPESLINIGNMGLGYSSKVESGNEINMLTEGFVLIGNASESVKQYARDNNIGVFTSNYFSQNISEATLAGKETIQFVINNTEISDVVYTSNDDKIASVSANGTITGLSKGTTYITAAVGMTYFKCKVTVTSDSGIAYTGFDDSSYVKVNKDNYSEWESKYRDYNSYLTEKFRNSESSLAVSAYQSQSYFESMFGADAVDSYYNNIGTERFGEGYEKMINALSHACDAELSRYRNPDNMLVYSGANNYTTGLITQGEPATVSNMRSAVGTSFNYPLFTSTTLDEIVSHNFYSGEDGVLMIIYADKKALDQHHGGYIGTYHGDIEYELLLSHWARYEVIDAGVRYVSADGFREDDTKLDSYERYVKLKLLYDEEEKPLDDTDSDDTEKTTDSEKPKSTDTEKTTDSEKPKSTDTEKTTDSEKPKSTDTDKSSSSNESKKTDSQKSDSSSATRNTSSQKSNSSSQTSSNKISNILTGDVTSYAVTILVILSASAFAAVLLTKRKETYH